MVHRRGDQMWLRAAFGALLLLLAAFAASAAASDPAAQFKIDAAGHQRDLRDLYSIRRVAPPRRGAVDVESIASFLRAERQPSGYPDNTALLFYAAHDGKLRSYLIGKQGLIAFAEAAVDERDLWNAAERLRFALDVDGLERSRAPRWRGETTEPVPAPPKKPQPFNRAADAMAKLLLPAAIKRELAQVDHLVIIANGLIGTVPFAVLPISDDKVLIDAMSISLSAGLFDVDQMVEPWRGREEYRGALIVGDPLVPVQTQWDIPPLPGAETEAKRLGAMVDVAPLIGAEATKQAVQSRMQYASLLYFAAHGVSNPLDPLTGGMLMLSGPDVPSAFLSAKELQQFRMEASLAVLSACQSGLGKTHDGGVIGLARSFQKAGVPRVVMSLWNVSDAATLDLMESFNRHAMTQIPAQALRLAMLETREKYPEPAFWAPFTLFGTPR